MKHQPEKKDMATATTTNGKPAQTPTPNGKEALGAAPLAYSPDRIVIVPKQSNPYSKKDDEYGFFQRCLDQGSCKMSRIRKFAEEGFSFDSDTDFMNTIINPFHAEKMFLFVEDLDKAARAKLDAATKKLLAIK
jgi:hypothetical protein